MEHALIFPNSQNQNLVGVWHEPDEKAKAAVVMLHGWSGTRTGPHQMLTRAARAFCQNGYAVLRFDFAGRGDSDGETELSTLATMQSDARAALEAVRAQTEAPIWLLGLCSGCEIAVAALENPLEGAILWSAPVFAALPDDCDQKAKRAANWKRYARKLCNPATYVKIWKGQVDTQNVKKAMAGAGGAAHKNLESSEAGQLPIGFRKAALENFRAFNGQLWQIYGGADPIFDSARRFYCENRKLEPRLHIVAGANHSFYGLNWEREVIEVTLGWLEEWRARPVEN